MKKENKEMLKLSHEEVSHELDSLMELQVDLSTSVDVFIKSDMTDKLGRYGIKSYSRKFANNPSGNVCSHMRTFNFMKDMSGLVDKQIEELKHEKIRLERLIGTPNV